MNDYNEFHVHLIPDLQDAGKWNVQLGECPRVGMEGFKGSVQPAVTAEHLTSLRSKNVWPNLKKLKTIGKMVWKSVMTPQLESDFSDCLELSKQANRGLRLVVSMVGEDQDSPGGGIRMQELPLEALYHDTYSFLATSIATPVSRSLKFAAELSALRVTLPLRILAVVSTPSDKPQSTSAVEKGVIQKALQPYIDDGSVQLEFCDPPTSPELESRLKKGFHILHFVGHGSFDYEGDDPTPRAYLCLEKNGLSDAKDADTLNIMLQNSGIRLVVITACSSAAPSTPDEVHENIGPFDGVAQRLVTGNSDVSAVVAMQFDMEEDAAVIFSETFYTNFFVPDKPLDAVVAECRHALGVKKNAGHRAWVTPVLYWRCKDGQLFKLLPFKKPLDDQTRMKLNGLEIQKRTLLDHIAQVGKLPLEMRSTQAIAEMVKEWEQNIDLLQKTAADLHGEALRLRGGPVKAGETVSCALNLLCQVDAQVGDVALNLRYPADKVAFVDALPGAHTPGSVPLSGSSAVNERRLLLPSVSQGEQWSAGEYEIARLVFNVPAGVTDALIEIEILDAVVQKDGTKTPFETLNAVICVNP